MNHTIRWAAAVAAACLLTACGGPAPVKAPGRTNYQQALAFSKCMRAHGDPSWPDPGPEGAFPNDNGSLDKSSPQFKKARAACHKLEPGSPDASVIQRDYRQMLKYSACMRAHGVPKFPDPEVDAHGTGVTVSGDIDTSSPQYKKAAQVCRHLQPGEDR